MNGGNTAVATSENGGSEFSTDGADGFEGASADADGPGTTTDPADDDAPDAEQDAHAAAVDNAESMRVRAAAMVESNPELSHILENAAPPGLDSTAAWNENATRDEYNSAIGLVWRTPLGDYDPEPIAVFTVVDTNREQTIAIPVQGNDFLIRNASSTGNGDWGARNASSQGDRPRLVVGGKTYTASRDTTLSASTGRPQGTERTLVSKNAMLLAFDKYVPKPGDKPILYLTSLAQYGTQTLSVHRPDIRPYYPSIDDITGNAVPVVDIRPTNFKPVAGRTVIKPDYVVGTWGGKSATAIAQVFNLPPAREYFLTTVIRLGSDWSKEGGKLPGLSNTGLGTNVNNRPLVIDGVDCQNSGWGGRPARGCRWSARTGWGGRSGDLVGLHTYFYAQNPSATWGVEVPWPTAAPVGEWFAYVERVRVNDPGEANGRLSYWICTKKGCAAQFDKRDITWSVGSFKESLITEAWANVYCGGTGCPGPDPWPTSTAYLKRMTVTTGLPDLGSLFAEVQNMNSGTQPKP